MSEEQASAPRGTLNLEAIRLWEQALRSSEFQQGTGRLGYHEITLETECGVTERRCGPMLNCCLGVLCEVAIRNGVPLERTVVRRDYGDPNDVVIEYDRERDFLPQAVVEWAGLTESNPYLQVQLNRYEEGRYNDMGRYPAAELNDADVSGMVVGLTFVEIADAIRETYLKQTPGEADE